MNKNNSTEENKIKEIKMTSTPRASSKAPVGVAYGPADGRGY